MRNPKIQFFNIVEVALALAIVGIGIAGIMSLFPVALNASRDSVGDNNAPDVAEQFLSFIEAKAFSVSSTSWDSSGFIGTQITDTVASISTDDFDISSAVSSVGNIYQKTNAIDTQYKVVQSSGANSIPDFSAIVRVWKGLITKVNIENSSSDMTNYKYGAALYVEISWPAEKPYANREKRIYYLELFNPNAS